MTRRHAAGAIVIAAIAAAIVGPIQLGPVVRGSGFHVYADLRAWQGLWNAADVLSNVGFLVVAAAFIPLGRDQRASSARFTTAVALGVAAIGIGSAAYHTAPSDTLLALDWAPIVVTLALLAAAVLDDRLGRRAGTAAVILGPLAAIGAVAWWYAGGGTTGGGDMAPYGAVQLLGIALPVVVAIVAPGRIPAGPLVAAAGCFGLARLLTAKDALLFESLGISGHSLKHLAMAVAAGFALRALRMPRASPPADP